MKNKITVASAILISFVAGISIAAFQPDNSYDRAAKAIQGEHALIHIFGDVDKERFRKARQRAEHWARIMEQFEP